MMNLFEYIKENQILIGNEDRISYINKSIVYLKDSELDKIVELIKSMTGDFDFKENSKIVDDELFNRLGGRKYKFRYDIYRILNKNKDFGNLAEYYKKGEFIDIHKLLNSNNILDEILKKTGLSEQTVEGLLNISGGGRPAMGKGEILLNIICADMNGKKPGDVVLNDGYVLEIKFPPAAILYDYDDVWNDPDLKELQDALRRDENNNSEDSEFEKLLVKKTGIKNYVNLNKLWGAYMIYKYETFEKFTDLLIGNYLIPGKYSLIKDVQKGVNHIYEQIKNLPFEYQLPASSGKCRCRVEYPKGTNKTTRRVKNKKII